MGVIILNDENFEKEVLKQEKKVLIDFYADWCGPCKMQSPIIDSVEEELADSIKVGKINVDDNPELASNFEIMSIPTLIIIKNGEVIKQFVGITSKSELIEALK